MCERFNYAGLRTILVLYLSTILNYTDDESTMIYHGFIFLSYFMPLFGAILADSYWGKFKTIIRLSIVYAIGNAILTGASMANSFTLDSQRFITIVGLICIALGTGGIKPCCYTFGGEQFQLPEQQDQLSQFFRRFLTGVYIGSLISTFLTPELRKNAQCFGRDTCFPLAFGLLSLLMTTAIVVFILGRNLYVKKKPENHVIFKTFGCILYGVREKIVSSSSSEAHWLDIAGNKYSKTEVSDTKTALEVLYPYIAYPVFWALYEQQGSRWTLQATLMDGKFDGISWDIKPDQMQTIHPLLALLLIFSLDRVLYPILAKFGIRQPLQKLMFGTSMAALAFLLTAVLQYKIFGDSTVIPTTEGQFVVYNGFDCNARVLSSSLQLVGNNDIDPLGSAKFKYTPNSDEGVINIKLKLNESCDAYVNYDTLDTNVTVSRGESISYFLTSSSINKEVHLRRIDHYDDFTKSKNGHPSLRIIVDDDIEMDGSLMLVNAQKNQLSYNISSFTNENFIQVAFGNYNLVHGEGRISSNINLIPATIYTLVIRRNDGDSQGLESKLYATDEGNYLHILWQTPQYLCMIVADVIFIATSIELTFTQAPPRIKSFMSACYSMTHSVGNLVVVVISALSFRKQVHEYLFFSGLMLADTFLLAYLSYNYKYKAFRQRLDDNNDDDNVVTNQSEVQLDGK
ncbi:peptide transporter family 2-like isoform X2 [Metopolophium dirhodum]|nr:peptide transporter family 2-like isoform X2 [Metopolophium dirhodum]